ncbi:carbohydrate deacetylase [Bizionia myxarmorum]|uniref:ChbG/HpnK family deacetylase n=1 Tax=Bizionia myxarmorum TaxID=291186 RepID=A0A5D0RER6_9FLAO|nr:ChbG/HpnK family deacetylase [Bizionia myxarmorum]TYB79044.1 ChbG/HpnK family deacetylase [Bizionia myxarmorum]
MIKLITNSDDFGLTDSITNAIIDTHLNGIMTSTTMMSNMAGFEYAAKMAKENPNLGVGIHFNLTEGKPITEVSKIPDLIDAQGNFRSNAVQRKNFLFGKHKLTQIELELQNQLENLLDNQIIPTHFDSHHHITGVPLAFKASANIAKQYQINKARVTNIDFLYSSFYQGSSLSKVKHIFKNAPKAFIHKRNKTQLRKQGFHTPDTKTLPNRVLPVLNDPIEQFIRTLSMLKAGVTEISFHPGYLNADPNDSKKTAELRMRDLKIANSVEVRQYTIDNNIQLINFKNI